MTNSNSKSSNKSNGKSNNNGNNNSNDQASEIQSHISRMRDLMQETHASRRNFRLAWRLDQLERLKRMVSEQYESILTALHDDLGKVRTEAACMELGALMAELDWFLANAASFMGTKHVPSPGLICPAYSTITAMPRNGPAVLVIGPSNYPISISLMAVAGSLAAGNPTVLKPSELCPACATLLAKCIPDYLEASALQVVTGGVPETTALLAHPWGLIHFTGSERVGTIVAQAAALTLTPVVLELGGKCPCVVDETCPASTLGLVANRIIWSKTVNCGQNCISPDYLLVHKSHIDALVPELKRALKEQFGENGGKQPTSTDSENNNTPGILSKLVAPGHVTRAVSLIQEVEERSKTDPSIQLLTGGSQQCDASTNFVAPTMILNPPMDARVMTEELFCPILPIIVVNDRDEAVDIINHRMEGTPLGLYVFTSSDDVFTEMTERCRSGTAVRNDLVVQFAGPHLPFGGLGTSGMGAYRGLNSLKCFSHMLPAVHRVLVSGADLHSLRCQPYAPWKSFVLEKIAPLVPSIPVLTTIKRAAVVSLVAMALLKLVPGADVPVNAFRMGLASILRKTADSLVV